MRECIVTSHFGAILLNLMVIILSVLAIKQLILIIGNILNDGVDYLIDRMPTWTYH